MERVFVKRGVTFSILRGIFEHGCMPCKEIILRGNFCIMADIDRIGKMYKLRSTVDAVCPKCTKTAPEGTPAIFNTVAGAISCAAEIAQLICLETQTFPFKLIGAEIVPLSIHAKDTPDTN